MRSYEKFNPDKSERVFVKRKIVKDEPSGKRYTVTNIAIGYLKKEETLQPLQFFVIVVEGEKKEPTYFKCITRNPETFKRIKIDVTPKPEGPVKMLETAKERQEYFLQSQGEVPDRIYLVSDVDKFMGQLLKIKPICEVLNIQLIISNPCFELWLYYASCSKKIDNFPFPEDMSKMSQVFKTWTGPLNLDPRKAIPKIQQNIANAAKFYEEDEYHIPKLFSTSMFRLAEDLLPLIDKELEQWSNDKEQKKA